MRSMTGYGRRQLTLDGREITVEIKTVNHRFLDVSMRLPRTLSFAEEAVRKQLGRHLRRGHADVTVSYVNLRTDARIVRVDEGLAAQYQQAIKTLGKVLDGTGDIDPAAFIASQPDVLTVTVAEEDQAAVLQLLEQAVGEALEQLCDMRDKEGENLRKDLAFHLDAAADLREKILTRAPSVVEDYRARLQQKLSQMITDAVEPQRLAQEVAIMADRCAIDEELSRLDSHIGQMRKYFNTQGEIGKKMDFLIQEMNREANTIGSKASDAAIAQWVVDLKSEIEKMREQVQNVE